MYSRIREVVPRIGAPRLKEDPRVSSLGVPDAVKFEDDRSLPGEEERPRSGGDVPPLQGVETLPHPAGDVSSHPNGSSSRRSLRRVRFVAA